MRGGNFLNKIKGISIVAITLLILQIFSINFGLYGVSEAAQKEVNGSVNVKSSKIANDTLTWEISISATGEESAYANTKVVFSAGQSHGSISVDEEIDVEKTTNGYVIETTTDGSVYKVEVTTKIIDEKERDFQLRAEMDLDGETTVDVAIAEVKVEVEVEDRGENSTTETDHGKEVIESIIEEGKSLDDVIAELSKKPINQYTEAEIRKLIEGLSEGEIKQIAEALGLEEEIGVVDPNFKPFAINKSMRSFTMMSTPSWPAPGSVKLNGKTATPKGNYGEWEIELSVEAKDMDTTRVTDIVLVFDKSGSMQGSRLTKAKAAATQFVNELLSSESQTRIAIVTFSTEYQTLAGGFHGFSGRQSLLDAIDEITATGGTNIQGGLRHANNLLAGNESTAQNKVIVLLSDGAPTYSYK